MNSAKFTVADKIYTKNERKMKHYLIKEDELIFLSKDLINVSIAHILTPIARWTACTNDTAVVKAD